MTRTPEQVKADDALTEAIEAAQRAYHGEVEGVLTTYVVLAKRKWWGDEDGTYNGYYRLTKDNDVPVDEQLGLVEYAATRLRLIINESGGE